MTFQTFKNFLDTSLSELFQMTKQTHGTSKNGFFMQHKTLNGLEVVEVSSESSTSAPSGRSSHIIRIPALLGQRYRVVDFLSKGGQGAVFVAEDLTLMNRKVLIKMSLIGEKWLTYGFEGDWSGFQERNEALVNEARHLVHIRQRSESRAPCLLRLVRDVYVDAYLHPQASQHDGSAVEVIYLVMQYLPGQTLKELIQEVAQGKHATYKLNELAWWRACLNWTRQLSSILHKLHQLDSSGTGLIYCDLKPENCIVSQRDITLIDFGALKEFTSEGSLGKALSTQGYSAPELDDTLYHDDLNGKVDIYSVGAMLWAMLSGKRPNTYCLYGVKSPDLMAIPDALPPNLPASVRALLERCMHRDRDARPSAEELKKLCIQAMNKL